MFVEKASNDLQGRWWPVDGAVQRLIQCVPMKMWTSSLMSCWYVPVVFVRHYMLPKNCTVSYPLYREDLFQVFLSKINSYKCEWHSCLLLQKLIHSSCFTSCFDSSIPSQNSLRVSYQSTGTTLKADWYTSVAPHGNMWRLDWNRRTFHQQPSSFCAFSLCVSSFQTSRQQRLSQMTRSLSQWVTTHLSALCLVMSSKGNA